MADITLSGDADLDLSNQTGSDGNSRNTNDVIIGGDGDNTIVAGPEDQQYVTETNPKGKEQTFEVQDNDLIVEASGDNTLTGGYGNDKFKFVIDFGVSTQTVTHELTYGVAAPGIGPTANLNGQWNSWLDGLNAWRAEMAALYGADSDAGTDTVSYLYANNAKKGYQSGSATFDNDFSWTETTTTVNTNTSTNLITDFGNGNDEIQLAGVTAEQFAQYGNVSQVGDDTVITIGSFSITVAGADMLSVMANLAFV